MKHKVIGIPIAALLLIGSSLQAQTEFYMQRAEKKGQKKQFSLYPRPGSSQENLAQPRTAFFSAAVRRSESSAPSFFPQPSL